MGRPRIEISADTVYKLAKLHCTQTEIAGFFNVALRTFEKRLQDDPEVRESYEAGLAAGKIGLRKTQFRHAERNPIMAIFLGKQILGQRDKIEHTGENGGPMIFATIADIMKARRDRRRLAQQAALTVEAPALPAPEPEAPVPDAVLVAESPAA